MNVLILTPDRVGSTLLQRLLTVYMLRKGFDQPVINLHELTNGLIKYYNETLNQEVLGHLQQKDKNYNQSIPEILDLLKTTNHFKTARLAHYHLLNRNDNASDLLNFYEYLNNNFYIISCRRENLFEHALSWVIRAHSKKLNVYSAEEKINVFNKIYANGISGFKEQIEFYLNRYKQYVEWSEKFFNIQSYFYYDKNINNLEDYILNLDFMKGQENNSWNDMFGQTFNEFNTCRRVLPNLILNKDIKMPPAIENQTIPMLELSEVLHTIDRPKDYHDIDKQENLNLITPDLNLMLNNVDVVIDRPTFNFLKKNLKTYCSTVNQINKLVVDGFLVSTIPFKLQSLAEKRKIIKNFNECLEWYNSWSKENKFGQQYTDEQILLMSTNEELQLGHPIYTLLE